MDGRSTFLGDDPSRMRNISLTAHVLVSLEATAPNLQVILIIFYYYYFDQNSGRQNVPNNYLNAKIKCGKVRNIALELLENNNSIKTAPRLIG